MDVWSLGVIMYGIVDVRYTLMYGRPPFETSDVKRTYKRIKECQYTFNEDVPVSSSLKSLITKILVVDPSKRLTLEEMLSHPFMSTCKIPKHLSSSMLSQTPNRSFLEQHTPHYSSHKYIGGKAETNTTKADSGL